MKSSISRRISLCDLLLIVAMTSLGMATLKITLGQLSHGWYLRHWPRWSSHGGPRTPLDFLEAPYNLCLINIVPLLLVANCTVVCLYIQPSRSSKFSRLMQRPGFVLCLIAITVAAITAVGKGVLSLGGWNFAIELWRIIIFGVLPNVGGSMLIGWLALKIAIKDQRRVSFVDTCGVIISWIWTALLALECCRWILEGARIM